MRRFEINCIYRRFVVPIAAVLCSFFLFTNVTFGQSEFEGDTIESIRLVVDGISSQGSENESYLRSIREAVGTTYSTVRIRDAIEQLNSEKDILAVEVIADRKSDNAVGLTFTIRRKPKAKSVSLTIDGSSDSKVTEQELLYKLNLLDPGAVVTEETLQENANAILEYLRERGYLRSKVTYEKQQLAAPNEVAVKFKVTPGEPARVESVKVNIEGFDSASVAKTFKLKPGVPYSRELLQGDNERVRSELIKKGYLAPEMNESKAVYDGDTNTVVVDISGKPGPVVEVVVVGDKAKISDKNKKSLLPVAYEGTLDYAAIVEGARRLENHYQEQGYFFATVTPVCSIVPIAGTASTPPIEPESEALCARLSSADLDGNKAIVRYQVDLGRRFKLNDIRLEGTDLFTIEDIMPVLESQRANALGIIPALGYGRGYTSSRILQQDTATIMSLLHSLGYRNATVRVNQGVSPDGEGLIITFVVDIGEPTIISGVSIEGNTAFTDAELLAQMPPLVGERFSRARVRNAQIQLATFYSQNGYFFARVDYSIDESLTNLPVTPGTPAVPPTVKVNFTVHNEGKPVYIRRILVTGNEDTRTDSILRALAMQEGELLLASDIFLSEQRLYESDVFSHIETITRAAGDRPDGSQNVDVIINVTEHAQRIASWGGGYSTDVGWSGFADFRHLNLTGRLWQAGARVNISQLRQLVQVDFVNPRFLRDGENRFSPLTISAMYQRDSTVTRFFRSAFDQGTFGIVQRVDKNGNPIDEFGSHVADPTLNRFTLTAETNRTLSRGSRSAIFIRYRYEDVRLYDIESLLIKDLLLPDSNIRTSGFGVTFVRDTRRNCTPRSTFLETVETGELPDPCRYSATDPTKGSYLTAEYNVSLPALGANIGFNKFQASYNFFHTFPKFRNTTFAARGILGLGNVFKETDRFGPPEFPGLEKILPISERFFAGGSTTLRGFAFEEAGPRVVVVPEGEFRDSNGEVVVLNPFSIPFGGNALAVVNLEARIPVSKSIRVVPFYDGGNVFRKIGDIFNPPTVEPTDYFQRNLLVEWTHTVGLGLRLKTPIGGEFAVDYGYLLNPSKFFIPQPVGPPAIYQLSPSRIHFRFSQAF